MFKQQIELKCPIQLAVEFLRREFFAYYDRNKKRLVLPFVSLLSFAEFILEKGCSSNFDLEPLLEQAEVFFTQLEKARNTSDISDYLLDAKTEPFRHQIAAYSLLSQLGSGCFFDSMGLGKTKVAIDLCTDLVRSEPSSRILVVCSKSLLYVWKNEIEAHSSLSYTLLVGSKQVRKSLLEKNSALFITSYDTAKNDMVLLQQLVWDYLILDEAHKLKDPKTLRFMALKQLKYKRCLVLSGTPIGTGSENLWTLLHLVAPKFAHSYKDFLKYFYVFESRSFWVPSRQRSYKVQVPVSCKNLDKLQGYLDCISIRRLKDDVLDLPPKIFSIIPVKLGLEQQALYDEYANASTTASNHSSDLVLESKPVSIKNTLEKYVRLHQITSHLATIVPDSKVSAKCEVLDDLLLEALSTDTSTKVVVWGLFIPSLLALHSRYKDLYGAVLLYGELGSQERDEVVVRFQTDPACRVLISNISIGGEGYTFTAAQIEIFYDLTFSYIQYIQAVDRLHRIGTKSLVNIFLLIAVETIDEIILEALNSRQSLSDYLIDKIGSLEASCKKSHI